MRTSVKKSQISQKSVYSVLLLVLISGICAGAFLPMFFDIQSMARFGFLHQNFIFKGSVEIFSLFVKNIKYTLILLGVLFLCGFSAVFQPIELCVVFLHGLACGLSVTYYYIFFGLRGVFIVALLILPCFAAKSLFLIVAARCAVRLSNFVGKALIGDFDSYKNAEALVGNYLLVFALLPVFTAVLCLVQAFAVSALRGIL